MDLSLAAAVSRRLRLLREAARQTYELAWSDSEQSFERATTRIEELFDAYDGFLQLALSQSTGSSQGWTRELVVTLDDEHDVTLELVFTLNPLAAAAAQPPATASQHALTTDWGDPFP